jgi:hypothetical protein
MSEAVLTYRACATWTLENARIASRREDSDRLLARARRYMDLAERLERQEQQQAAKQP